MWAECESLFVSQARWTLGSPWGWDPAKSWSCEWLDIVTAWGHLCGQGPSLYKCHRLENAVDYWNSWVFFLPGPNMVSQKLLEWQQFLACWTHGGFLTPECSHVEPVLAPSSWDVLSHPGVKELCCCKSPALYLEALGKVGQGGRNHRHMSLPKASCGVGGPQPALYFLHRGKRNQDVNLLWRQGSLELSLEVSFRGRNSWKDLREKRHVFGWWWVKLKSKQPELWEDSQMVLIALSQLVLFYDGLKESQGMTSWVKWITWLIEKIHESWFFPPILWCVLAGFWSLL